MKLGWKLFLASALPAVAVSAGLGAISAWRQESLLRAAFERRGETLARGLAERAGEFIHQGKGGPDLAASLWEEDGLAAVTVQDLRGNEISAWRAEADAGEHFVMKRPVLLPPLPGEEIRESAGVVTVALSTAPVRVAIDDSYRAVLWASLLAGGLAAAVALLLSGLLSRPLRRLSQASARLAKGELGLHVQAQGDDELSSLTRDFNVMSAALAARDAALTKSRDQLAQTASALEESLRARAKLEAAKEELSDLVIHDLKSPLTGIVGAAQILLDSVSQEDRPFMEGILSRAEALLGLIQDLLAIRKMEEAGIPLAPEPCRLLDKAREVTRHLEPLAREAGFSFAVAGEETTVMADPHLVARLIENLASNALKYHRGARPIRVELRSRDGGALLTVSDDGRGIPAALQQAIFERFRQIPDAQRTDRRGTGLGLSFCRMAAEAHGGRIWVESVEEKGATFSVWLPVSTQERAARPQEEPRPALLAPQHSYA